MERDREAVGLVSDLLDQVERRRAGRQDHRRVVPGDEQLLVRLCQARHRDGHAHPVQLLAHGVELRLAAVQDEKVGAGAKALVGHALGRVATRDDLCHADDVVGLVELGANLEAAVLRLVGLAGREDDHRGDGVLAMDGRDVEALDPHGRGVQGKRALQLEKRLVGTLVVVAGAQLVAHQGMTGVVGRHLRQMGLLATLRHVDRDLAAAAAAQPLGDGIGVGRGHGNVDL